MRFVPLLWLTFAGLLGFGGMQLLGACAIHLPFSLSFGRCVAPPDRKELNEAFTRGQELRQRIGLLEIAILDRSDCAPPTPPKSAQETKSRDVAEIEKRVEKAGGKTGSLQISLSWDTIEDLDLYVTCPTGETIWARDLERCGGILDIDANGSGNVPTNNPVENIVWTSESPTGPYHIAIRYAQSHGRNSGPVPFKILLKKGLREPEVHTGKIDNSVDAVQVHDFSIP